MHAGGTVAFVSAPIRFERDCASLITAAVGRGWVSKMTGAVTPTTVTPRSCQPASAGPLERERERERVDHRTMPPRGGSRERGTERLTGLPACSAELPVWYYTHAVLEWAGVTLKGLLVGAGIHPPFHCWIVAWMVGTRAQSSVLPPDPPGLASRSCWALTTKVLEPMQPALVPTAFTRSILDVFVTQVGGDSYGGDYLRLHPG
ncbi:hypothetical protein GGR56DRAFT_228109 [Xylariaceae sp. FL0804]|nr:hypothetical protein GGR56DRAFT_228109 [Xylariaceae sp. FL0804]